MGANTACGHYVAHLKKDGRWVIFNDEKASREGGTSVQDLDLHLTEVQCLQRCRRLSKEEPWVFYKEPRRMDTPVAGLDLHHVL